jgi:hypothetical protein
MNNNSRELQHLALLIRSYLTLTAASVLALCLLTALDPHQATSHAWGHAVIVVAFAILLPLRLRAARAGKRSGLRAVGLISGVLLAVNVIEGCLTGVFPLWMRIEMFCVAVLMAATVMLVIRVALGHSHRGVSA